MNTPSLPRRILTAIHASPLARILPLPTALAAYLLFLLMGLGEQKLVLAVITPVVCAVVYFLFSGVILRLLQNPRYTGKTDPELIFLLLTAVFALAALALLVQFLTDMAYGFTAGMPVSLTIWHAISAAYRKHTDL